MEINNLFLLFFICIIEVLGLWLMMSKLVARNSSSTILDLFYIFSLTILSFLTNTMDPLIHLFVLYPMSILLYSYLFKRELYKSLIGLLLSIILLLCSQFLYVTITQFFVSREIMNSSFYALGGNIFSLFAMFLISKHPFTKILSEFVNNISKSIVLMICYNILFFIGTYKIIADFLVKNKVVSSILPLTAFLFAGIVLNIIMIVIFFNLAEKQKKLEIENSYIGIIREITDEIRRRQHEYGNRLNTLNSIVALSPENELKDRIKSYLSPLVDDFTNYERFVQIDNHIIAAIIYGKLAKIRNLSISFNYYIEPDFNLENIHSHELSDILNILIDNAIDATIELPLESRNIDLKLYKTEKKHIIEVKNTTLPLSLEFAEKIFEAGFSTRDSKNRGYGLSRLKKIVEEYGGNIDISPLPETITFKILI